MPGEAARPVAAKAAMRRARLSVATAVVVMIVALCAASALFVRYGYIAWDRGKLGLPRRLNETEIRPDDLPALAEALSRGSAAVRYAALVFDTPDRPTDEGAINIQMSVEGGRLGFDWVLLGPRNIEDREQFIRFAQAHGVEPIAHSLNGVSYLRVEDTYVPKFTSSVVTEMYHLSPHDPVGLVYEGFEWSDS
jgi:hypothetical protein